MEDKSGNIWFGTGGGGVVKYDGYTFTNFTQADGLGYDVVFSILEDKVGNLWFGTNGGGVSKYDGKCFTNYTETEGLSNNNIKVIVEDKSGNLWFGTNGGGITKYDGKRFTHFTKAQGLCHNSIMSVLEDKSGNLWFGTYGGGVSKYDGKFFTHFTEKEGLSNNAVFSIMQDDNGSLWFGTRSGLSKLSNSKLKLFNKKIKSKAITEKDIFFKSYNYLDGFLGIGVNGGQTMLEAKDGTIWIAANDRLTAYHPPKVDAPDTIPPNIQLTGLGLFNENIAWQNLEKKKDSSILLRNGVSVGNFEFEGISKWYGLPHNLSLAYSNNYLTFTFIGITMNQSEKVKYQYILEGNDENWSAITSKNEVAYGNLDFGSYTFKVKAMNSEGYWSKPFSYAFNIRPPWWKTTWFRVFAVSGFLFLIYIVFRWRTKTLRERQKVLEKTVELRTAEVVLQKNEAEKQKLIAQMQKDEIAEKQKEIIDSIYYAKRIQQALLPSGKYIEKVFGRLKK